MVCARSRQGLRAQGARLLLTVSVSALALPATAHAQGVDYPQLEQVFGQPVTTSVTGKPQRASETPASLVIITRDDIRRSPARDLAGLLSTYAGIDVARWTAGQADVSIRGGVQPVNPRLLVLVNGQQVYLDFYGMTNWAGIGVQLEEIQQIEVVKGPNGALFGFNAVSGVINIITVNPLQRQQTTATLEIGTEGHRRASASAAFKLDDRVGARLSGGYTASDELDGLESALIYQGGRTLRPMHAEGAAELYAKLGDHTEAGISASHSYSRANQMTNGLIIVGDFEKFTALGARISHDAGWGTLSANVYRNISVSEAETAGALQFRGRNVITVASADAVFRAGTANTFRAGIEYRDNKVDTVPGHPATIRFRIASASGMWESVLSDAWTTTLAARVDHLRMRLDGEIGLPNLFTREDYTRSVTEWSLNASLVFRPDERNSFRVSVARGVQPPSLHDFGSHVVAQVPFIPVPFVYSGDPTVSPTVIWSGEAAYTRAIDRIGGQLELIAFHHDSRNLISSPFPLTPPRLAPPLAPYFLTTVENVGSFRAFGLFARLNGRASRHVSWLLNYAWIHGDQDVEGNTAATTTWPINLGSSTPRHKVNAQLSYEQDGWLATIAARYKSGTHQLLITTTSALPVDIGPMLSIDAKIAWKASEKLTFELAGENLTDVAGVDHSPFAAERRLRVAARISL